MVEHERCSVEFPIQFVVFKYRSKFSAVELQNLWRVCVPKPQVTEHVDQFDQLLQFARTELKFMNLSGKVIKVDYHKLKHGMS